MIQFYLLKHHIDLLWNTQNIEELWGIYQQSVISKSQKERYHAYYAYALVYSVKKESWSLPYHPIETFFYYFKDRRLYTLTELEHCLHILKALPISDVHLLVDKNLSSLEHYESEVLDYIDPEDWSENIGIIKGYKSLSESNTN